MRRPHWHQVSICDACGGDGCDECRQDGISEVCWCGRPATMFEASRQLNDAGREFGRQVSAILRLDDLVDWLARRLR